MQTDSSYVVELQNWVVVVVVVSVCFLCLWQKTFNTVIIEFQSKNICTDDETISLNKRAPSPAINLRTGEKGIFPAMYATDLTFLEEDGELNVLLLVFASIIIFI